MRQKSGKVISTIKESVKRSGIIKRAVGLGLAVMMMLEAPSWSGLIELAFAHEDRAGAGRCIYVDTSLIGADSDVMESGIGAYVYDREGNSYSDAPVIMQQVEGKRNIYQLVLDEYYTYVEFTKGSDLNTDNKTGQLAIDWSLGAPCYMFNSQALSDGGHFYGLYTVYFDPDNASGAGAFTDNGVGVYAYNSEEDSYAAVPVAMKESGKGEGVYEYSFDRPYECIAFMGGYGSWNYEAATTPVYMEWNNSAPCFFLKEVNGFESTGIWRNLRYVVFFDASDIKEDEAFIENGVYLYAFSDSGDKLSENPVKMVASSLGGSLYEYTMEYPYENLQFILGDSFEAEVQSEVLTNDWMTYAEPCYKMNLDRKEMLMASPSMSPSASPSGSPSASPGMTPSVSPSGSPSATPSGDPSASPSGSPSATPGTTPSMSPTGSPSATPGMTPSMSPSATPGTRPGASPSATPGVTPSANPTAIPSADPTAAPTEIPTLKPTEEPTPEPTQEPEPAPTEEPVPESTPEPIQDENQESGQDEAQEQSDEKPRALEPEQARIRVTYGSYEMTWVGTENTEALSPAAIEPEEEEPERLEEPADTEDKADTEDTDGNQEEPVTPAKPSEDADGDPTPAPTMGGAADGTLAPSGDDMAEAEPSPSATPTGEEEGPTVETSMSLLSSTGATMMFQSAGVLPRIGDGKVRTIYFDTTGTDGWSDNWGQNTKNEMYIYLFGDNWNSGIQRMSKSERTSIVTSTPGVLWEYELNETEIEKATAIIFLPQNSWPDTSNQHHQTVNVQLYTGALKVNGAYPCYSLDGANMEGGNRKVKYWGEMGPVSQAANDIYFFDMTSKLKTDEIVAKFSGEGLSEETVHRNADNVYKIPGDNIILNQPYSTVAFYDGEGRQIGETYNFLNKTSDGTKGFSYDKDTMNTFYYGATEKADGTKLSFWGAPLKPEAPLAGKKLYFDKLYFKVPVTASMAGGLYEESAQNSAYTEDDGADAGENADAPDNTDGETMADADAEAAENAADTTSIEMYETRAVMTAAAAGAAGAKFQIGTDAPVNLTADANDARTYSYVFDSAATASSQTILTYLDPDGAKYHFFWDEFDLEEDGNIITDGNNLVTQEYGIARVMGKYELGNFIYFDATMSKMPYEGNDNGAGIPLKGGVVYCLMAKGSDYSNARTVPMTKVEDRETWKDVWRVSLDEGYTYVKFANYEIGRNNGAYANGTDLMKVPDNIVDPCFYADNGDAAMYGNNWRGGYWEEVYTIRDPEEIKEDPVVDIAQEDYTRSSNVLYVKATLYDYYTDYELNGNNRDNLSGFDNMSFRDWVPFRQFNQALSEYYKEAGEQIPLYTGHFQPNGQGGAFSGIADKLDLYGFANYNNFISVNNAQMNSDGNGSDVRAVAQGLVADELRDGQLYASGNRAALPYFNEEFLAGDNSKNAVLGRVYEDVSLPFEMIENVHGDEPGVSYWVYDSDRKSLEMKQTSDGAYYLAASTLKWWSKNRESNDAEKGSYGFFPFNSGSTHGARSYNYGFGAKLEIKFRLPEDGTVEKAGEGTDNTADIKFDFSGDDDVWVFIDGHLALDMGGDHAAAHGSLNFADRTYTIDYVKKSAASNGSTTGSFYIDGVEDGKYDTREHTLTMFYMERGMWESNMKISFNFPDENQLEVEKQVNTDAVNELFKTVFDGQKIFEFSVRNLATHFDTQEVRNEGLEEEKKLFNTTFNGSIGTTWDTTRFEYKSEYAGHADVVLWNAAQNDSGSAWRHRRYGCIKTTEGPIDVTKYRYLQFSYYYPGAGVPSTSSMYLQILDGAGNASTHKLSGNVYGSPALKSNEWDTVTVDLNKFLQEDGLDRTNITEIRFGYDYTHDFYLDDFIFKAQLESQKLTGFITKQPDIPDYDTAWDSRLKIPIGAMYTRKLEGTDDSYGRIDQDGTFALENHEAVLFRDQFRRGSYIELKEIGTSPAFTTTWTMYENGQRVNGMTTGDTVAIANTGRSLIDQQSLTVEDGRTEQYSNGSKDGELLANAYNGTKPAEDVFVFRSYADPDSDSGVTKLKVVYTNTVNVGNLKITKSQAEGSQDLNEEYQFRITFTNIAGMGLEGDTPIVMEFGLAKGGEEIIAGIPVGTDYVIEELKPNDKSFLENVTTQGNGDFEFDAETKLVRGRILAAGYEDTVDFSNMLKPVISIEVTKVWKDAAGNELKEDPDHPEIKILPESLRIRIQRRIKGSDGTWEEVEKYQEDVALGTGYERSWQYTFTDLEKYVDNTDRTKGMYEYRVVEINDTDPDNPVVVKDGGLWHEYQTGYDTENHIISGTEVETAEEELYSSIITNVHLVSLKIVKQDASGKPLKDVSFQLQRKTESGEWVPVEVATKSFDSESASVNTITQDSLKTTSAGTCTFVNLPAGSYRLAETQTQPNYSLLADYIQIEIENSDGEMICKVNGATAPIYKDDDISPAGANVFKITIRNQQNLMLPATGSTGQIPFTVGGLSICSIAGLMYIDNMRKRRKEGKAS